MAHARLVALARPLNPGEGEISDGAADSDRQTQVDVERHEDEHQCQTEPQLDEVQQRLKPVRPTQYSNPPVTQRNTHGTSRNSHVHSYLTGRLHGTIVGPTGRSDPGYVRLSVRPVGQIGRTDCSRTAHICQSHQCGLIADYNTAYAAA